MAQSQGYVGYGVDGVSGMEQVFLRMVLVFSASHHSTDLVLYIHCYNRCATRSTSSHEKHYLSPLSGFTSDLTLGRTQSEERECKNDGFVVSRNEIINKVRVLTSVV